MFETLCEALRRHQIVELTYKGERRRLEPHIVGYDHSGQPIVSAWQLSGGSGRSFRTYHMDELSDVALTPMRFLRPRPGYNPEHDIFERVVCRL